MPMKNITQFLQENQDTIFRYLIYNKFNIWTPEQFEKKYCDESVYLDIRYKFAKITDAIETPDGLLLELSIVDEEDHTYYNHKDYKLLNEISLEKFDIDNKDEDE